MFGKIAFKGYAILYSFVMSNLRKNLHLLPLLLTVFIDSLGFGLVMPLLAPLLMDPSSSFLSETTSIESRGWIFSFVIASYCIGQFFGSPILGAISDRLGRKKILMATIVFGFAGYVLGAISVGFFSVIGLFVARVMAGVAAGNYPIAQSYIADETEGKNKAKTFGLLGMAWGTGFVIGPYVGGKCVDESVCSLFNWSTPFWIAALLCLANLILVILFLKDSSFVPKIRKISLTAGFIDVKKAFQHPKLRVLFQVMFIFCFGWGFFIEFSPFFLIRKLNFSVGDIANFFALVGLWVAVCQGILIRPLLKRFSSQALLACALLGFSVLLFATSFVKTSFQIFMFLPFLAFVESLIFPSASSMISNHTPKENQGEILGIYNSLQWAAIGITPLFSGSFIIKFPSLPFTVSSFCMFLAFSVFVWFWMRSKEKFLSDTTP